MSTSTMPIIKGLFLLLLFGYSMSASNRRCSPLYDGGSFCFTQPDPPVNLSWSSAMQWCKNMNATLPIVNSSYHYSVYQNALGYFGLQAETLWLGANSTYDPDNWFWTDGSNFTGDIESSNSSDQTSAYVMRNGSALMFGAANPSEYNYYICQVGYSELVCVSNPNTFWTNGKCYYKHNSYYSTVSWYSFLSNCGPSSLPSYDDLKEFSRWLDNLVKFWIGLRCGWWSWHDMVSGRSFALTQNWAGGYLPSVVYGQCLASYSSYSYGASYWTSLDCTRTLPFVCQENVNVKQSETTAHKLFTTESEETTSSFNNGPRSNPSDRGLTGLAIGLGVGLGGGLLLVVVLLTLYACRKHRDTNYSLVDLPNQSANNQNTTAPIAYVNYAFNVASGALGRNIERNPYEPVNHKANEYVY